MVVSETFFSKNTKWSYKFGVRFSNLDSEFGFEDQFKTPSYVLWQYVL